MESVIKAYSDIVAAVARKQQVLSLILRELITTESDWSASVADFISKNQERIVNMKGPLQTDSDIRDFNEQFGDNEESYAVVVAAQVNLVMTQLGIELQESEFARFRDDLWDAVSTELAQRINEVWNNAHKDV